MSSFKRLNTAITNLPPKSASKVFCFIEKLFENSLEKEYFKNNFWNYNTGEQHFICYYLNIYFNSSERYTFFNDWLQQKEKSYLDAGEELSTFYDYKEDFEQNKTELLNILDSYKSTAERRFKTLLKHNIPYDRYSDYFKQEKIDFKIPLYYKPKPFKEFFIEKMKGLMIASDAERFFFNSFDYGNNIFPVELLKIQLDNHREIKERILDVKKHYNEQQKFQLEKALLSYNKRINKLPENKRDWYGDFKPNPPTSVDFAKIIYNAFPQFRDKAINKDLNTFLINLGKNLVER